MNARVPSIGSMYHVYSPQAQALTFFLGDDAVVRIARRDRRAQHALDRAIGVRHGVERARALVLDGDGTAKVRLRDAARRASELQREVFELEDVDFRHADADPIDDLNEPAAPQLSRRIAERGRA